MDAIFPADFCVFPIRSRQPSKVKFVYRTIISGHSTFGACLEGDNDAPLLRRARAFGEPPAMKLGFFTMPIHPPEKDWRQSLQEDREAFLLADELGFTEGYVGEHVTDKAENITSSIAFLAWIAAATKRIRLGTGTINMPNIHPATVAASIAMLDHMLDGRLIFGISPGGLLSDAEVFGNLGADRNAMFLEAINQVLQIWASEPPYNLQGKYWNISTQKTLITEIGQGFIARPRQRPTPPIVVTAVAPFSKGVTEGAARGWGAPSAKLLMAAR